MRETRTAIKKTDRTVKDRIAKKDRIVKKARIVRKVPTVRAPTTATKRDNVPNKSKTIRRHQVLDPNMMTTTMQARVPARTEAREKRRNLPSRGRVLEVAGMTSMIKFR